MINWIYVMEYGFLEQDMIELERKIVHGFKKYFEGEFQVSRTPVPRGKRIVPNTIQEGKFNKGGRNKTISSPRPPAPKASKPTHETNMTNDADKSLSKIENEIANNPIIDKKHGDFI